MQEHISEDGRRPRSRGERGGPEQTAACLLRRSIVEMDPEARRQTAVSFGWMRRCAGQLGEIEPKCNIFILTE